MPRLYPLFIILAFTVAGLRAQSGYAEIHSSPDSALVLIDDLPRGTTPLFVTLSIGPHRAVIKGRDGSSLAIMLEIAENTVVRCDVVLPPRWSYRRLFGAIPMPTDGGVTVLTAPSGAEISIDGRSTGATTPATINDVPPGRHVVRAVQFVERLQDRFAVAETVVVGSGSITVLRIDYEANTVEGRLRLVSNAPRIAISLRHTASGKRYDVRQPGEFRLVTGTYEIERMDTTSIPLPAEPVVVTADSLTELSLTVLHVMRPIKKLAEHTSYVSWDAFLQRSFTPRPLFATRNELTVRESFAWWLSGGTAFLLAGRITDADAAARRASPDNPSGVFQGLGVAMLAAGAVLCTSIDTVHIDLSFNQQANQRDEEFLAGRYAEIMKTWQQQVDDENKAIEAENRRRAAANAALPPPVVRRLPLHP